MKVLLVGDGEYYGPYLSHGRFPIRRDYLATLVEALDAADAKVIGLDFSLALPSASDSTPGSYGAIPSEYRVETEKLMRTIADVAQRRPVVLPKRVWFGHNYPYVLLPDIFGPFGICAKLNPDGTWSNPGTKKFPLTPVAQRNISCGYINLPYDLRTLPPRLRIGADLYVDSFALALVKAIDSDASTHLERGRYYGTYIPPAAMRKYHAVVSAGALRRGDQHARIRVEHEPVIVGGGWHVDYGREHLVDTHYTPIGATTGAIIHANFAEALLDGRSYTYVSRNVLRGLDVLFGVFAVLVFAGFESIAGNLMAFVALSVLLLFLEYLMWISLGTFFDAFIPLLGIWLHSLLERFIDIEAGLRALTNRSLRWRRGNRS